MIATKSRHLQYRRSENKEYICEWSDC